MAVSRFTPEVRGGLVERFAAGVSTRDACSALGLREKTVQGWLTRGRSEGVGEYGAFAAAVDGARAAARARPEPMDEVELARVVSEAARKGSVAAMKLRWLMLSRPPVDEDDEEGVPDGPLAELDELAARRRAG